MVQKFWRGKLLYLNLCIDISTYTFPETFTNIFESQHTMTIIYDKYYDKHDKISFLNNKHMVNN